MYLDKENLETPYFMINKTKVDELVDDISSSLKRYWDNGIVGYSFKTNNLPWIIKYMKNKGLYAEVVSSDEFSLALDLGYSAENIIFNGPVKGKKEFFYALEHSSIVNIDSKREIDWLNECKNVTGKIGIRVNFDLEKYCPNESQCGSNDGRFGFSYETGEFKEALDKIKNLGIDISGIHLHCSSKTRSMNIYRAIAEMAVRIVSEYDLNLEYVDIGGGFFGGLKDKPSFNEYFCLVKNIFNGEKRLFTTQVIVEPGMSVIGASIDYVASVVDVKSTLHNRFVLTDGSRIHIDPLMRKSGYSYKVDYGNNQLREELESQIISGFTCMENDRFFDMVGKPNLVSGDRIIFEKVGAYTMGLAPLFIQFFPTVYVNDGQGVKLARDRWTSKEFLSK